MKYQKSRNYTVAYLCIIVLAFMGCSQKKTDHDLNSIKQFNEWFTDPPSEFRSAPLWDWNEVISKEEILFQMDEFRNAGIGGVFIHPRPGLITEYISDEWHELFDYTVKAGKELGMTVWIYDENSYPSGFAGGHVPEQMPDSYQHGSGLSVEIQDVFKPTSGETYEVVLKKTNDGFEDISTNLNDNKGSKGKFYLFKKTFPAKSYWYGGKTYVDLLYPGVTEKFLEITMKGYEKYNKADFGTDLPGIFTDEPNLEAAMSRGTVVRWTPDLWNAFKERWGYDLRINLPSLIEEVGNWKKVRHDYYELILELFIDRWAKPCYEYCEQSNLDWTGHYWEHGWPKPTHGFDEAAFYIWHQQPGVDMLGNEYIKNGLGEQFGNTRAVRELRSAANQAGRRRTLSETYGGGGWEMDFANFKKLADWQCALGVNFVNQHLSYYSLKGVRKFDYPPSFSYHEPWWDNYKIMGDYIGRISMATAFGEQKNSILLLQPNTTAWMYFSRLNPNSTIDKIQSDFKNFIYKLENKHFEYDLGSEHVLKTLGSVNDGKMVVGERGYKVVMIPRQMENLDRSTFNLLLQFLEHEGKVISFNENISRIDGVESDEVADLIEKFPDHWLVAKDMDDPLVISLFQLNEFEIEDMAENSELYHQRRILNDGQLLFFVNSSENDFSKVKVIAEGKSVAKYNLIEGSKSVYPSKFKNGKTIFTFDLDPIGSALFYISNKKMKEAEVEPVKKSVETLQGGKLDIEVESENILVVDYLDLKTSKSEWEGIYFMDALVNLFKENGIDFGNPWQHKIQYKKNYVDLDTFTEGSGFEVDYHFEISEGTDLDLLSDIKVVVERPELWSVKINGEEISLIPMEYWIDKEFPIYHIGNFLKAGINKITLKAQRMSVFAELMPIYIIGDFSLRPAQKSFAICNGNMENLGSWKENGMPFYSQKVSYSQNFMIKKDQAAFKLNLPAWEGTLAEVWANNSKVGIIAWPPYELDLSTHLANGENNITVKIIGSLKNTFGFFYRENNKWIYGPYEWNYASKEQPSSEKYYLMDYGLFEPFELHKVQE